MRLIKTMSKEDLLLSCVDLLTRTYVEIGRDNIEVESIDNMAQSLAYDLYRIYKNFYFEDAVNAFRLGVRSKIKSDFIHLTVPVYIKWLEEHKELIWYARSLVDQGEDPKQVLHYRPEPKLLK